MRTENPTHAPRIVNRKARHRFHVLESLEVGVELLGTEVKSIRQGQCSLDQAFARFEGGQCRLYECNIAPYTYGNQLNHEPTRPRKLLLHRRQIARLDSEVRLQKLTLIPLTVYFLRGRVKVELGLCKAKNAADKRDALKSKDAQRDVDRALRDR